MIKQNKTSIEITTIIANHNSSDYNFLKLAEECTELSDILIKMVTKPSGREERIPKLIEELGDVQLRIGILAEAMNIHSNIVDRTNQKLQYLDTMIIGKGYANY